MCNNQGTGTRVCDSVWLCPHLPLLAFFHWCVLWRPVSRAMGDGASVFKGGANFQTEGRDADDRTVGDLDRAVIQRMRRSAEVLEKPLDLTRTKATGTTEIVISCVNLLFGGRHF